MSKPTADTQKQATPDRADANQGEHTPPYAIGKVIRQRRKEIGSTLEHVASVAGIGTGFLSDIERNKASPSVATLFKICDALGISIGSLFQSDQSVFVQADKRESMSYGGQNILFQLLNSRNSRSISAVLGELAPNARSGEDMHVLQSDEQFIFVIKGEMIWEFEDHSYHLREGDALTIDPTRKHRYFNPSCETSCQTLCIISPPPK
ncbi:cupin domain-containing protein [Roseovarius sp. S4756]|uniref:cupin domain-containing protein n=1 Tax=Roseovarius maritimus TaxID=3342637 RepID=UPI00372993DA